MNKDELLKKYGPESPLRFGSAGEIHFVDCMGDDLAVVQAARTSYGSGTKSSSEDEQLLRYLMRCQHWTPFEMTTIKLCIQMPIHVRNQLIRHRTAAVNEYSLRYSLPIEEHEFTDPDEWRLQSANSKQGSAGYLDEWPPLDSLESTHLNSQVRNARVMKLTPGEFLSARETELFTLSDQVYQERIALGVAREQARKDLPLSTYTRLYWCINSRNLLNFLRLRMDSHAQQEIRELANHIANIFADWMPWTWKAFEDYELNSIKLNANDLTALQNIIIGWPTITDIEGNLGSLIHLPQDKRVSLLSDCGLTSKSERIEFIQKMKHLFGLQEEQ